MQTNIREGSVPVAEKYLIKYDETFLYGMYTKYGPHATGFDKWCTFEICVRDNFT